MIIVIGFCGEVSRAFEIRRPTQIEQEISLSVIRYPLIGGVSEECVCGRTNIDCRIRSTLSIARIEFVRFLDVLPFCLQKVVNIAIQNCQAGLYFLLQTY